MLGAMPLSALFVLFDFVIHNPNHGETKRNLNLLDVAAGYFNRIEYVTKGSLPSSVLSDFSHIARQFVRSVQHEQSGEVQRIPPPTETNSWTQQAIGMSPSVSVRCSLHLSIALPCNPR